jgi:glycosyltransferase involved in cell wall biosynthesis
MSNYTDWQKGIANRNYHILRTLAKDERIEKIIAVDFLPIGFSWKRKLKYFYCNLIKGVKACDKENKICIGGETRFGDFTSRCYQIKSKIYIYSSINNIKKVSEELLEIKKRLDLENLVVWSYNPFIANVEEIKKTLDAKTIVFDTVDDWSTHRVYKKQKNLLKKNYQKIKDQSDIIFTVSKDLKEKLFNNENKVHWIPNGVDADHYNKPENHIPNSMKDLKKPIIGYEGVIQERLEIELIKYLAQKNPDKSFVFVGWLWRGLDEIINREFANLENVRFLGRKTYDELPNYIHLFDVAIIPHKINEFTKSMNPLKIYEYLACGKPIVSTKISGVEEFENFIKVAGDKEEFNKYINQALNSDNEELHKARIEEARKHTWEDRVERMLEIIFNFTG